MFIVILDAILALMDLGLGISYFAIGKTVLGVLWCLQSPIWGWISYMQYKQHKDK